MTVQLTQNLVRLCLIFFGVSFEHPKKLQTIPEGLQGRITVNIEPENHSSPVRKILGSYELEATRDSGLIVQISILVLEGSSRCVIGSNVTRRANDDIW